MRLIDADKFGMYLTDVQLAYRGWKDDACETLDDVMRALDGIPTVDAVDIVSAVPVDDMFCEMMNWAARYAIGRRTYAASDTANYILKLVDKLDNTTLNCLKNDIEAASSLGDDCDKKEWLKLLDAVKEELERRRNERKRKPSRALHAGRHGVHRCDRGGGDRVARHRGGMHRKRDQVSVALEAEKRRGGLRKSAMVY